MKLDIEPDISQSKPQSRKSDKNVGGGKAPAITKQNNKPSLRVHQLQ